MIDRDKETQYRFTKRDGTVRYEFLDTDQPDTIPRLRELMQLHAAVKAEPVEAPACPLCVGPVCPIIDHTEETQ